MKKPRTRSLLEAARVVRSKNSGPYELTLDILFKSRKWYEHFKAKRIITAARIAKLYGVDQADVLSLVYFEPACALKATIRRPLPSGAVGDTDIYGAQQHAPLLTIEYEDV
ncbi:MAG: DUF4387 domain-containing protein [Candidatus Competibacteraceae bacterium]|nr:DUF4387 domain-containing protein [Candidatus Competibacteraceae bacterium]